MPVVAPKVNMDHLTLTWFQLFCQQPTMNELEKALKKCREDCSAAHWVLSHEGNCFVREFVVEGSECPNCGRVHVFKISFALWKNPVPFHLDIWFDRLDIPEGGHYLRVRTREGIIANLISFERVDAQD